MFGYLEKKCLEWCFYKLEVTRWGSKYLDSWPNTYSNCHIIREIGAGITPWNYSIQSLKNKIK